MTISVWFFCLLYSRTIWMFSVQYWNGLFGAEDFFFFAFFYSLQSWLVLSHRFELWRSPKSAVLHWYQNNQIQAPSGFHLVWISFLSVLYRWILQCRHIWIFCHFWFMGSSKLAQLGHRRHTIPLYRVADCELHLEMWIILFSFLLFFFFSLNSLTGIGTNTSLNQQCSTVVVIMKVSLMPTSFIKKTCGHLGAPEFPRCGNMTLITDTAHAKPRENCSLLQEHFQRIPLKNNNWWSWLWAKALSALKAFRRLTIQFPNQYFINWIEVQCSLLIKKVWLLRRVNV